MFRSFFFYFTCIILLEKCQKWISQPICCRFHLIHYIRIVSRLFFVYFFSFFLSISEFRHSNVPSLSLCHIIRIHNTQLHCIHFQRQFWFFGIVFFYFALSFVLICILWENAIGSYESVERDKTILNYDWNDVHSFSSRGRLVKCQINQIGIKQKPCSFVKAGFQTFCFFFFHFKILYKYRKQCPMYRSKPWKKMQPTYNFQKVCFELYFVLGTLFALQRAFFNARSVHNRFRFQIDQ